MSFRSLLTTTLVSTLLACSLAACSSEDGSPAASADDVGDDAQAETGESELRADSYVAQWASDSAGLNQFTSLTLKKGGWYEASLPPSCPAGMACPEVLRVESGRYSVLRSSDKQTLRLVPRGAAVRRYQIAFAPTAAVLGAPRAIELTRSGASQVLHEVKATSGVACGTSQCGPGLVCCNPLDGICTLPGEFCTQ